jgi:hypothetical protein
MLFRPVERRIDRDVADEVGRVAHACRLCPSERDWCCRYPQDVDDGIAIV